MKIFFARSLRLFAWIIVHLPLRVRFLLGDILGLLWFDVFRIRRQVVMDNLNRVYPDKSNSEKVRIGRWSLRNMGRDLIEYCYLPFLKQEQCDSLFKFEGEEHLEKALSQGKGVCLLTAHMGNGDLSCSALSLKGYKVHLISKVFKMQWLNDLWFGMRERVGTKFIAPRNSSYHVLKALKKKEIVIFVLDQFTGPPIGVRTTFFGHETGTGFGLALMAQRSGSPVVPIYTTRNSDGTHNIKILPEIPFKDQEDRDESLVSMTQEYNYCLERIVLECPEQWMWVHKRWKIFRED